MELPQSSSVLVGFSIINHPFWDTHIDGNLDHWPNGCHPWRQHWHERPPADVAWKKWEISGMIESAMIGIQDGFPFLGYQSTSRWLVTPLKCFPFGIMWHHVTTEGGGTGKLDKSKPLPVHDQVPCGPQTWLAGKCQGFYLEKIIVAKMGDFSATKMVARRWPGGPAQLDEASDIPPSVSAMRTLLLIPEKTFLGLSDSPWHPKSGKQPFFSGQFSGISSWFVRVTLWLFYIAMEHDPFIDNLWSFSIIYLLRMVLCHRYVKLPDPIFGLQLG